MEEKQLKERIVFLRAKFNEQGLDVEKLISILKRDQLLAPELVAGIEKQTTNADKRDRLLDEIVNAKDITYQNLLMAVEQCLPSVYVTPIPCYSHISSPGIATESSSASFTTDSEDDVMRVRIAPNLMDTHVKEFPAGYKMTNILSIRPYNTSASSSFPALNDRCSPLSFSEERHSPLEIIRKQINSDNRLDWLHIKKQFDGALRELETLKQQNAEKMSQLSKEAEYFRNMYKRSESVGQQAQEDLRTVQTLNVELMAIKKQLQEDLAQLQKLREEDKHEMGELRAQHNKAITALSGPSAGTADVLTDLYDASLQKYDILRKDYDEVRVRYADLMAKHSSTCCQLEAMHDLRNQLDEMRRERDAIMRDKIAFQQQCTTVIQDLQQMIHENRKFKALLENIRHEHEGCAKDQRQAQAKQAQLQKDCKQALAERDSAIQEYRQVMSERDSVHKEIEQLQDKLTDKSKLTDKYAKEKNVAEKEIERLKQEIASAVAMRDKYRQESQSAMETRVQLESERKELQREFQLMEQQRDIARKERHQALEQMDILIKESYEKSQKEKAEEMDQVAKETEVLKKQIDKIKLELTDAEQEALMATKRRDWAFSEIDKTVQERESIRTLCDNLRRDRDRAVSKLAKALRHSDECEKQKNDAVKELKEIRDKYEAVVERDARRQQLNSVGHNHSRDSAIDADLQEWETEILEIEMDGGDGHDIGFDIVGGKESPQFPGDNALIISHVTKGGAAEGKLRVNDLLLKVNNLDTTNTERRRAEQALRKHSRALTLVVRRRKLSSGRIWQPPQLLLSCQKEGSIQIEQGLFISAVHPGWVISKDGLLPNFGDRIVRINNQLAENLTAQEATKLLEKSSQPVVLEVSRQVSPISSTGSSPTPTTVSVLSPLPDQSVGMSKSEMLVTHNSLWDSASGDSARSGGSSKNLRSSGSQTDSLDSPGPSPRKSLRNHDHDKGHHSLPVLGLAKELVVEKIFRSHKQQNRDPDLGRQRPREDVHEKGCGIVKNRGQNGDHDCDGNVKKSDHNLSGQVSSINQTPYKESDNVIVEFCSLGFSRLSPDTGGKSRKREYEADSISGTWPKSRTGVNVMNPTTVPSTLMFVPPKERPSIKNPLIFQPPVLQHKTGVESGNRNSMCHSQQHSDSSNVKYQVGIPISDPFIMSPKAPTSPQSTSHISFPKQWPPAASHFQSAQYPKMAQVAPVHSYPQQYSRHQTPHLQVGGPHSQPVPIHPGVRINHPEACITNQLHQRLTQIPGVKSQPAASNRVHNIDKQWPPGSSWTSQLRPGQHHPPFSPSTFPHETGMSTVRPTSLEAPYTKFRDIPGNDIPRLTSPVVSLVGPGLSGRSAYSSSPHYCPAAVSNGPNCPVVMNSRSPPGAVSPISPETEIEHALFFPLPPASTLSDQHSSPSPSQQSFTGLDRVTPTPSEEFGHPRYIPQGHHNRPLSDVDIRQSGGYPRHDKHLQRICIPSNNSAKSGSVEIVSDRSSPVSSIFRFDSSGSNGGKQQCIPSNRDDYLYSPRHHETRTITFEKSSEPVGFQIQRGSAGGIFVSAVYDNSLASQAGLEIGDQLLEVCGINMRNATHEHAVTVLRQCGNNLSMKVQYNPEKYMDGQENASTASITTSPTHSKLSSGDSDQSTPKHHTPQHSKSNSSADGIYDHPHVVQFSRPKGDIGPGFSIVGGNAVGIFVHEIQPDTSTASVLQQGDMILEYNNVKFKGLTAEQANLELQKPCSTMRLTVVNCVNKYNKVQNIPGDHFFIRANFSRGAEGEGELDFQKDDILFVESTVHRGTLGLWLAWIVDEHCNKIRCGSIPSRFRLENEMVLRRSHSESWSLGDSDELKGSRRGSGSARRSFFRRRRHQCSSSKDSRDLGSFSDASLNSESVPILDESVMGYTQVERIEYERTRPVVLLAPLADPLIQKLMSESPDKYKFCEPCTVRALMKDMEQNLAEGRLVDFWKKDDYFECIQVNHIRDLCDKEIHCLLNVNPRAVERLHRLKIYPIVIFVRHKSHKQIKEVRDAQFLPDKLTSKVAKDSFDHFTKLEQEYSHLFSTVVPGGNLAEMSTNIKAAIIAEQKKALWVTVSNL